MKKYKLTDESMNYRGRTLWRIEDIASGEKGGWIESESNLSHTGRCMILDEAKVYGNAKVYDNAIISGFSNVYDEAEVFGNAVVSAYVSVFDQAKIYGNAEVTNDAVVKNKAQVLGYAQVERFAEIMGHAVVYGHAKISGNAEIQDYARVYGYSQVLNSAVVKDKGLVHGHVIVKNSTIVEGEEELFDGQYTWDDINTFSKLRLYIQDGISGDYARLYANGRHQVQVEVILEAKDEEARYIQIPETEILQNIVFVNYRNDPFDNRFQYSDSPGEYCASRLLQDDLSSRIVESSSASVYFSTVEPMGETVVCVSCLITRVKNGVVTVEEYSTALENNSRRPMPDSVTLQVVPQYIFSNEDIEVVESKEEDSTYTLRANYVRFHTNGIHRLRNGECIDDTSFYYSKVQKLGKVIYYSACSTDSLVEVNDDLFTTTFDKWIGEKFTVTSRNHEYTGLCFWVFQSTIKKGATIFRNYPMFCSLFDIYGNEAKLSIQISRIDRTTLEVNVI
ncbi:carbonic anhydrase/acetyltransferase-like protein (isoleucine patch superfamily) [Myroides gitamensis]|uniref:transferase n=1 Tax=Myroides odoratus TaxID=256 RepID=UPI00216A5C40|nr:transferase [Myroides odoratus]MCS4239884.1 carbonic anhydrase/acetyltransferase-like protein (isoleucine patch superfamily) [Myroides odoratus]MDH6600582.1 carbonic anhydrase/acetyltransferase-like protein (isoleucine patch superfamily) [Myroides gitamensis]